MDTLKTREQRVRRAASRKGYTVRKWRQGSTGDWSQTKERTYSILDCQNIVRFAHLDTIDYVERCVNKIK